MHGRPAGERAAGDRHVVLTGLVAAQARSEPHIQRRVRGHRTAVRDAADVLAAGRQPGADEPGPRLPQAQHGRDVERPRRSVGQRRAAGERGLDRGESCLVVGGEVQAQVVVVERRLLEGGQRRRGRDRRRHPEHVGEVPGSPGGGEQQPGGPPRVAALERAQRGLEQPRVGRRGTAVDVEEQQPAEPGRHRVAVGVGHEVRLPRVLPGGQPGRLGAGRHVGDGGRAGAERHADPSPRDRAGAGRGPRAEQQAPPAQPGEPRRHRPRAGHDVGCQWNVKVTLCGFSHTPWYSRCRAETGGETSRVSLYVPAPGRTTSLP